MAEMYPPKLTTTFSVPQMFDADGSDQTVTHVIERPGLINSVALYPGWTMSGANTNTRTYTLLNLGQAGAGTAVVATLALTSGVNLTRGVAKTITLGAAADRVVVSGDTLMWRSAASGSGLPDPGGRVVIRQSYNP